MIIETLPAASKLFEKEKVREKGDVREKEKVRREMLQKRDRLTETDISEKSLLIEDRILASEEFRKADKIFAYIHCRSEVQTLSLIRKMIDAGKTVAVPITLSPKEGMFFSRLRKDDLSALKKARFGLTEPERIEPTEPDETTLFLIPGSAYDRSGNRLGYGAGYYDRYLESRKYMHLSGICYDLQLVGALVPEETDVPMDSVITECRHIRIDRRTDI